MARKNGNGLDVAIECPNNHDWHTIDFYTEGDGLCIDHYGNGRVQGWLKRDMWGLGGNVPFEKYQMALNTGYFMGKLKYTLLPLKLGKKNAQVHFKKIDVGFGAKLHGGMFSEFYVNPLNAEGTHATLVSGIKYVTFDGQGIFYGKGQIPVQGAPGIFDEVDIVLDEFGKVANVHNKITGFDGVEVSHEPKYFIICAYEPSNGHVFMTVWDGKETYDLFAKRIEMMGQFNTDFYPKNVNYVWKEGERPYGGRVLGWGDYVMKDNVAYVNFASSYNADVELSLKGGLIPKISGGFLTKGSLSDEGDIKGYLSEVWYE
jgi:hypothetical protein